jgi:hypothetical protein
MPRTCRTINEIATRLVAAFIYDAYPIGHRIAQRLNHLAVE